MSKISLKSSSSGTATFTIESPSTNTDRTLVLPDVAGTVLTSASNLAGVTGVGKVLQVVQATTVVNIQTSSTTYQATGLIASLTPTSASSKILVSVTGGGGWSAAADAGLDNKLYRQIASGGYSAITAQLQDWEVFGATSSVIAPHSFTYLDSPATTSQVFYQPYFRTNPNGTSATVRFNVGFFGTAADEMGVVTLTLMEIAA